MVPFLKDNSTLILVGISIITILLHLLLMTPRLRSESYNDGYESGYASGYSDGYIDGQRSAP